MNLDRTQIDRFVKETYKKGFFHLFTSNVLIQVFAFASQLFVAGILSPDDIGRIKIIQTYLGIFSIVAAMGFNSSTLKLCSEQHYSDQERHAIFSHGLFFTLFSSVVLYLILICLNHFQVLNSDDAIRFLIPMGMLPVITNSLFAVFVANSQAMKRIKIMTRLTIGNKLLSIIGIVLLTYFMGIKGYYIAYNLSYILMLLACFLLLYNRQKNRIEYTSQSIKTNFRLHWQYAKPSMLSNLFADGAMYLDIILIGFFVANMQEIGYYGFAATLTIVLRLFPSTVQQISIPYFSSFSTDKNSFMQTYRRYNKLLYIVVIASLLGAYLLIPLFIHWVFNGKYDNSIVFFVPLALSWSIRQLTQLQSGAIFGLGKMNYLFYNNVILIIINAVAYSISLYFWGLIGIAYASIATNAISFGFSLLFFRKACKEQLI